MLIRLLRLFWVNYLGGSQRWSGQLAISAQSHICSHQVTSAWRLPRASVQSCHLSSRRGRGTFRSERKWPFSTFGTQSDAPLRLRALATCSWKSDVRWPRGISKRRKDNACTCTDVLDFRTGARFTMEIEMAPQRNQIYADRKRGSEARLETRYPKLAAWSFIILPVFEEFIPRLRIHTSKTNMNQSTQERITCPK